MSFFFVLSSGTGAVAPGSTAPFAFKVPAVFSDAIASMPAGGGPAGPNANAAAAAAEAAAEEAAMAEIEAEAPGGGSGGVAEVVTMTKESGESWGFGLDPEYLLSGVHTIMSIAAGSVSARYDQLHPGVAVAAIGGRSLDGTGLDHIAEIIRDAGNTIVLTLGAALGPSAGANRADGTASPPPAVTAYAKGPETADEVMARTMADAIRKIEVRQLRHYFGTVSYVVISSMDHTRAV